MEPEQKQIQTLEFGNVNSDPIWIMTQTVKMVKKAVEMFASIAPTSTGNEHDDPMGHRVFVDVETMFRLIDEWLPCVFQIVMLQGETWGNDDNGRNKLTDNRFPGCSPQYTQGTVYREDSPLELIDLARDAGVALKVCQEFLAQLDRIGMVDAVKDMV